MLQNNLDSFVASFIIPLVKLGTGKKQSVLVIRVRLKPKYFQIASPLVCQPLGNAVQVQFEGSYRIVSIVVLPSRLLLTVERY